MDLKSRKFNSPLFTFLFAFIAVAVTGCSPTKHLKEGDYLLRKNTVKLQTPIKNKEQRTELRDNIYRLIVQQPNSYAIGIFPIKVWLYNARYKKYQKDTTNFQLESRIAEKPVIFDSTLVTKSSNNIKTYLFNQGFFYPRVSDTVVYKNRRAYVCYAVNTGTRFSIDKVTLNIDDSAIHKIVKHSMHETVLKQGAGFSNNMAEQERSRITNLLREHGYYKFTQENIIDFNLDTFQKETIKDTGLIAAKLEDILPPQKIPVPKTLDITVYIRTEDPDAHKKHVISEVRVYPDFIGREDFRDTTMITKRSFGMTFRYHNYYLRERVIHRYIYFDKGKTYNQSDFDATVNKLNQLNVFQSVRINLRDDTTKLEDTSIVPVNAVVLMTPAPKNDLTANFSLSTGTNYFLGVTPSLSFRNPNIGKGANQLTVSLSGGVETSYDVTREKGFLDKIQIITKLLGVNASLDLPKFVVPFKIHTTKKNTPRTVISFGTTLLDRVDFFTLTSTTSNFAYHWRETSTKNWEISPASINVIRLPSISDSFQRRLDSNEFLRNSYRQTFIEGESVTFRFSNQLDNKGRSYTSAKLMLEEAGGLISYVNKISPVKSFSQYVKFDFDVARYINRRKSQLVLRFNGGIGLPYSQSPTLPYIKQYFVGGAYSIRGWRIRSLGPGSFVDTVNTRSSAYIDRTGDIKLEWNAEHRYDITQMFSGAIKMKGATFIDAGNIWLSKPAANYPGGEFKLNRLGSDIAISAGAGLRFDIAGFLLLRFDLATPIKRPYSVNTRQWTFKEFKPSDPSWRSDNLVLNIAIGYPF